MNPQLKHLTLLTLGIGSLIVTFSFPRIGQDSYYHHFADQRTILGIQNFMDVITNLPFIVIGILALWSYRWKSVHADFSLAYFSLYSGIIGIGFGSAWYHYHPNNTTLVWDRLPMTITFMSYFSIIIGRYVHPRFGRVILLPLIAVGIVSVLYWRITEQQGLGDLRLYAWVQFFPMLCIPLILFLYPASKNVRLGISFVILVYAMAKVAEMSDDKFFQMGHLISGHSLKHLLAGISVLLILLTTRVTTEDASIDLQAYR